MSAPTQSGDNPPPYSKHFQPTLGPENHNQPERYEYSRIIDTPNAFRVLSLQPGTANDPLGCSLSVVKPRSNLRYAALSYVWGAEFRPHTITVDKKAMSIGENLYSFLIYIRHPSQQLQLWTDAICINQDDIEEKGHQVQMMGDIYRNAEIVYAWLGEDTHNLSNLLNFFTRSTRKSFIHEIETRESYCQILVEEAEAMVTLADLCQRKYWTRAWIVQELLLAKSVVLCIGQIRVQWREFSKLFEFGLLQWYKFFGWSCSEGISARIQTFIMSLETPPAQRRDSLESLLEHYSRQECLDKRDRVYSLLSLADDLGYLRSDYTASRMDLYVKLHHLVDGKILQAILEIPDIEVDYQQALGHVTDTQQLWGDLQDERTFPHHRQRYNQKSSTKNNVSASKSWSTIVNRFNWRGKQSASNTSHAPKNNRKVREGVQVQAYNLWEHKFSSSCSPPKFPYMTREQRQRYDTIFLATPRQNLYRISLSEAISHMSSSNISSPIQYIPILQAADTDQSYSYTPHQYANALHTIHIALQEQHDNVLAPPRSETELRI